MMQFILNNETIKKSCTEIARELNPYGPPPDELMWGGPCAISFSVCYVSFVCSYAKTDSLHLIGEGERKSNLKRRHNKTNEMACLMAVFPLFQLVNEIHQFIVFKYYMKWTHFVRLQKEILFLENEQRQKR